MICTCQTLWPDYQSQWAGDCLDWLNDTAVILIFHRAESISEELKERICILPASHTRNEFIVINYDFNARRVASCMRRCTFCIRVAGKKTLAKNSVY